MSPNALTISSVDDDKPDASPPVALVAEVLNNLISCESHLYQNSANSFLFVKFQSSQPPEITVKSYLERIRRFSRCSDACFIAMLIYFDRLIEQKSLKLTNLNIHRLIITCVVLAAKFHDDLFYNNAFYAKLGGLPLPEINQLEVELLKLLNFSLHINPAVFDSYQLRMQSYAQYRQQAQPSPCSVVHNLSPRFVPPVTHQWNATHLRFPSDVYSGSPCTSDDSLGLSSRHSSPSPCVFAPSPDKPHTQSGWAVPTSSLDAHAPQLMHPSQRPTSCPLPRHMYTYPPVSSVSVLQPPQLQQPQPHPCSYIASDMGMQWSVDPVATSYPPDSLIANYSFHHLHQPPQLDGFVPSTSHASHCYPSAVHHLHQGTYVQYDRYPPYPEVVIAQVSPCGWMAM